MSKETQNLMTGNLIYIVNKINSLINLNSLIRIENMAKTKKINFRELTDLVKNLREQLQLLKDQNRNLKGKVEEEVQARKRLENILKNNVLPNRNDIEWNED